MLDTFNEILTQNFSVNHPLLHGQYILAAGVTHNPIGATGCRNRFSQGC
jgi:hypothetical protein